MPAHGRCWCRTGRWIPAAATRLTTSTFDRLKADPKLGRAEALRQAMLGYLNDTSSPRNAYPAFWGPFALIGEGAAR